MKFIAVWQITGCISETRILTSQKNKDWRGYVAKIQTMGATFEVSVDTEDEFKQLENGKFFSLAGDFDTQSGKVRFVLRQIQPMKEAA